MDRTGTDLELIRIPQNKSAIQRSYVYEKHRQHQQNLHHVYNIKKK